MSRISHRRRSGDTLHFFKAGIVHCCGQQRVSFHLDKGEILVRSVNRVGQERDQLQFSV